MSEDNLKAWAGGAFARLALWLGMSAVALAAFGAVAVLITYLVITPRKFDLAEIELENRIPGVTFYDANDQWLAAPRTQHGEDVSLKGLRICEEKSGPTIAAADSLPKYLPQAFIAVEDRRFCKHGGIDLRGILRALWANFRAGHSVQGGSTITQQLARNLFLSNDKTISRKLKEMLYAVWLERHLKKDQILELYLNRIYFGAGTYGIDAAARLYFEKPANCQGSPTDEGSVTDEEKKAKCVTRAEAAMLAGLPKSPSRLSPTASEKSLEDAKGRAHFVLERMQEVGFLTAAERTQADADVEKLAPSDRTLGIQYYLDYVYEWLAENVPQTTEDLLVYTTLDSGLQHMAEETIKSYFCDPKAEMAGEDGEETPARHDPKQKQRCNASLATESASGDVSQAALVSIDLDGAVRAMVGGTSYLNSQFNRATKAQRQPGSAFKPFVYVTALEHGYTPDSIVDDAPFDPPIDTPQGPWNPTNYTNDYLGPVNLCDAITRSINTVAVRLSQSVGPAKVADVARRMGITSRLDADPAIALGSEEVNLLELTGAYAAFPRLGMKATTYRVRKVTTKSGQALFEYAPPEPERAITEDIAATMTSMLNRVIDRGTGQNARLSDRPAAGKTGTSSDWRDAWFMGYTAQLVTGVWLGNDDNSQMNHVTGGKLPARIWKDFMSKALADKPIVSLPGLHPVCRGINNDLKSFYVDLAAELGAIAGTTAAEQPAVPPPK
jgi:penicillin-binding protein 1A